MCECGEFLLLSLPSFIFSSGLFGLLGCLFCFFFPNRKKAWALGRVGGVGHYDNNILYEKFIVNKTKSDMMDFRVR